MNSVRSDALRVGEDTCRAFVDRDISKGYFMYFMHLYRADDENFTWNASVIHCSIGIYIDLLVPLFLLFLLVVKKESCVSSFL